ncbi:MAG: GntR family transcriptional regulator [Hyphomicrobiales bacterium]
MDTRLNLKPIDTSFSLKEHIYEVLKDGIASMNVYTEAAELRLDERRMSEQLGISRTPLREALARLEQEGFVDIQPRRGVYIRRKSLEEVLEMITVWAALESMAARMASERAADAEIASLRAMVADYNTDDARANLDEYSEANIRFHQRILELSKCKLLKEIADGLFVHMRAVRNRAMGQSNRVQRSVVDHIEIIKAIEARQPELAERLVREHTMSLHAHMRRTWDEVARQAPGGDTESAPQAAE